jgi:hypothetical protein
MGESLAVVGQGQLLGCGAAGAGVCGCGGLGRDVCVYEFPNVKEKEEQLLEQPVSISCEFLLLGGH